MESLAKYPDSKDDSNDSVKRDLGDINVPWKNPPSLLDLESEFKEARIDQQRYVKRIDGWLDKLLIRNTERKKKRSGRSKIQPKVIRTQAEWRYSSLTEPLISPKNLFKASPVTWDDKEAAEQNQLILNKQFNRDIRRGELIDEYVRTAVDQGTVIIKTGWESHTETAEREVPTFTLVPDPEFFETIKQVMTLRDNNPNAYEFDVPYELKAATERSEQEQFPFRPEITGSEIIQEEKVIYNRPVVQICDYNNVTFDMTCEGDYTKAKFVVHSFETCIADLEKDGRYHNLDKLLIEDNSRESDPDHESYATENNFNFRDRARKKFVAKEYWGFLDIYGDNVLHPVVITWAENMFIRMEENPYPDKEHPFTLVKFMPIASELYGEPDGALISEHQDVIGAITRGMIDIIGRSANAQIGRRKDALDMANKKKFEAGQDYEFNAGFNAQDSFYMHKFEEIPQSAQFMLQLMTNGAESLTGVKAFSGGLKSGELGDVATAVRGVLDSAQKRELGLLRRLAAGLIAVARKIAAMNGEFLSEKEIVRITNDQFVEVKRDELNGEFDLELTISTSEEDNQKAQEIAFMLQAAGDTIDPEMKRLFLVDWLKLRKLPDLAHKLENYQPQADPVQQQAQQLELQKLQAQIAELQSKVAENYAEAKLDQAKAEDIAAGTDLKALEFAETELGVTQERDMEKLGAQAKANIELEHVKQGYKQQEKAQDMFARKQEKDSELQTDLLKNYIASTRQPTSNNS